LRRQRDPELVEEEGYATSVNVEHFARRDEYI
jgi:hypothetical protein